jgi:hypothetical protein
MFRAWDPAMDQKPFDLVGLPEAYEAALTEERMLWGQIRNVEAGPVGRVMAYAQWRAAAERVKTLAIALHDPARAPDAVDAISREH